MSEIVKNTENATKEIQLYSSRAIAGATYLGGPLAAGYMIAENFRVLNQPSQGKTALILGIISTLLLFIVLISLPEHVINRIPNALIPVVYTAIIWSIVEQKQGKILADHKKNGNAFYSGWRAAGIGFVSLLILSACIIGYVFLSTDTASFEQYDSEIAIFIANEEATMTFYEHIDTESTFNLLQELKNTVIPKWKDNIDIIKRLDQQAELPEELAEQNKLLLKYAELRLETFELFQIAIADGSDLYNEELDRLHSEIDETVTQME